MSTRGLLFLLLGMLTIITISVTAGIQSYYEEQRQQVAEQVDRKLNELMLDQHWNGYEHHKFKDSTVVLFTNADDTILGMVIMKTNGDFSTSTRDTAEKTPFDWTHFGNGTDEYIGLRFNERPEDVVYVRVSTSDWSKTYPVNTSRDEGYVRTYLITLEESLHFDSTLETLDRNQQLLHSEAF
ncbi:MAG: hypothetical protein WAL07_12685 [Exiguobacterium chiriqhucha]